LQGGLGRKSRVQRGNWAKEYVAGSDIGRPPIGKGSGIRQSLSALSLQRGKVQQWKGEKRDESISTTRRRDRDITGQEGGGTNVEEGSLETQTL